MTDSPEYLAKTFTRSSPMEGPHPQANRVRRGQGLDWKAIREEYKRKATPEELDGPFDERGNLKGSEVAKANQRAKAQNSTSGRSRGVRGPRTVDWDEVRRLYVDEKLTVNQVAERLGCSSMAARNALQRMDVFVPNRDRKGGRPASTECSKGHAKEPGKHCPECDRQRHRDKYAKDNGK